MVISTGTLVFVGLVLAWFVYRIATRRIALLARGKLVIVVNKIINDDNASDLLKCRAVATLVLSMRTRFVPAAICNNLFSAKKKELKEEESEHELALKSVLLEHFFRVNLLAAPHWYLFFGFIFLLAVIVISMGSVFRKNEKIGYPTLSGLENAIIQPSFSMSNGDGNLCNAVASKQKPTRK